MRSSVQNPLFIDRPPPSDRDDRVAKTLLMSPRDNDSPTQAHTKHVPDSGFVTPAVNPSGPVCFRERYPLEHMYFKPAHGRREAVSPSGEQDADAVSTSDPSAFDGPYLPSPHAPDEIFPHLLQRPLVLPMVFGTDTEDTASAAADTFSSGLAEAPSQAPVQPAVDLAELDANVVAEDVLRELSEVEPSVASDLKPKAPETAVPTVDAEEPAVADALPTVAAVEEQTEDSQQVFQSVATPIELVVMARPGALSQPM
ncbi:hypothetical protein GPECTOR_82g247 [Gonium pectorale]|uniref:Uncharacterized protein n=1 Tax=Gonium pectorale TaxID=33097 RepID=A0A150G1H2_GONPE|nr:hypothetical protein GPECTOR_82g247 [Gonium pectorale]|eukprot:KXZ43713.1 hypothetical protein GPECTOR_82g247 [Gonium pectorale]